MMQGFFVGHAAQIPRTNKTFNIKLCCRFIAHDELVVYLGNKLSRCGVLNLLLAVERF